MRDPVVFTQVPVHYPISTLTFTHSPRSELMSKHHCNTFTSCKTNYNLPHPIITWCKTNYNGTLFPYNSVFSISMCRNLVKTISLCGGECISHEIGGKSRVESQVFWLPECTRTAIIIQNQRLPLSIAFGDKKQCEHQFHFVFEMPSLGNFRFDFHHHYPYSWLTMNLIAQRGGMHS